MGEGVGLMEERELVTAVVVDDEDTEKDEDDEDNDRDPLIGGQQQGAMIYK